jgi:hypothetical protein
MKHEPHPLFEVWLRVTPTVNHPRFFDLQSGYLIVWLSAEDKTDAAARACKLVPELPFEIVGTLVRVKIPDAARDCRFPPVIAQAIKGSREVAEIYGFACLPFMCPPGGEEEGFATEYEREAEQCDGGEMA